MLALCPRSPLSQVILYFMSLEHRISKLECLLSELISHLGLQHTSESEEEELESSLGKESEEEDNLNHLPLPPQKRQCLSSHNHLQQDNQYQTDTSHGSESPMQEDTHLVSLPRLMRSVLTRSSHPSITSADQQIASQILKSLSMQDHAPAHATSYTTQAQAQVYGQPSVPGDAKSK